MKILGISGSSRIKHTNYMLKTLLDATGADYELINLKDRKINSCQNCKSCHKSFECVQKDDMQEIYPKLIEADVIVLGSPTYFDNVSGIIKNFMDRCLPFYFSKKLANKKVVLLASAGFGEYVEYDENGECAWCKDGNECENSALKCINSMKYFSEILELKVIGSIHTFHGNPKTKEVELIKLGKNLIE